VYLLVWSKSIGEKSLRRLLKGTEMRKKV
jgi:hypothetical protein